ncbi:IclR family transcriptional regulator [Rhizobium sp.]|uniref:IclR family transcriptional regulator n=1 Tax=Rhizobium sp. TaxID=391 RepID=UPI000E887B49|nr:IclR family transcriptional regulator [Rhizobium sp.]
MSSQFDAGDESSSASKSSDSVPALRRAVLILDLITKVDRSLSAADITRLLGLPKSTTHGLLNVMLELNLLVRNPDGAFHLGAHPMRWADGFMSKMDILSVFKSYFAQDTALSRYTITLTVLDRDEVVYIGCRDSDQPLGQTFRIGMRLPAPFTATGKMLLSEMPIGALQRLFGATFPSPMTSKSVRSVEQLVGELAAIRERGFSIDDGQVRESMICVGSVIRDHTGKAIAGIATSLMRSEANPDVILELGGMMCKTANTLSKQLGYAL